MVGHAEMPSSFEIRMSLPLSPIVTMSLRTALAVRSGLIAVHESPRSVLLNTRLAPTSSVPLSFGENISGVSQWKRYASPAVAFVTFCKVGRMLFDSPSNLSLRVRLPSCDSV